MSTTRRVLRAAWPLVVCAFFGLPLCSLARHAADAPAFTALAFALVLTSALQPAVGFGLACLLLPNVHELEAWLGAPEAAQMLSALVFAFVVGAALRDALERRDVPSRLAGPAVILGGLVLASALVELAAEQASDRGASVPLEVWINLSDRYFFNAGPYADPHASMVWLGALAMAVYAERALRADAARAAAVVRGWFIGGALSAVPALVWLVGELGAAPGHRLARFVEILAHERVSILHPDVNAAGSYFALYLVAAIVLAVLTRRWRLTAIAGSLVSVAFVLAQSRAAIGAALFVLVVFGLRTLLHERRRAVAGAVAALGLIVGLGTIAWTGLSHATPSYALAIRLDMTRVALRMARDHPLFGIGLGQYINASAQYITDRLPALYRFAPDGENAHNNYLQILVELGLPALVAFLWMVVPPARPWRRWAEGTAVPNEGKAIAAGLAAFLVSAIFGHPLLIPEVLVVLFLALGVSAGLMPAPQPPAGLTRAAVWTAVIAIAVTLPWRMHAEFAVQPDVVGVGGVGGYLDALEFRPALQDSSWPIAAEAQALNLPLRWRGPASAACHVDVRFDGRDAGALGLSSDRWLPYRLELPAPGRGVRTRMLDLHVSDASCHLLAGPLRLEFTR